MQMHNIEKINGGIYNAGGGLECSVSLRELTTLCEQCTGNKISIAQQSENRVADIRVYLTDNSYVTKITGWQPLYKPAQIIEEITEWIRSNEKDLKPVLN